MGSTAFITDSLLQGFIPQIFIETGTFQGQGLADILSRYPNLDAYHSIEINQEFYDTARKRFEHNPKVHIHLGATIDVLPNILVRIPVSASILFWLDAHLPSLTAAGFEGIDLSRDIPLENELKIIKEIRMSAKDLIIADDLRIYQDGPFTSGAWPGRNAYSTNGISFIKEIFDDRHITTSYEDTGYIIIR